MPATGGTVNCDRPGRGRSRQLAMLFPDFLTFLANNAALGVLALVA
jgi:hypothetical protein